MTELNLHAAATMLLTVIALVLFTRERLRLEFSCLLILAALTVGFELFPFIRDNEVLRAGMILRAFGNEALITIVLLLILAKGVELSGALRTLARWLGILWSRNQSLALLMTLIVAAVLSAFVNNTPIVVMMIPLLVGVAQQSNIPPSRILMPVGFATIIGGMSTTIGTSSNLLVVSVAADLGAPQLEMFDFILPATFAAGTAILYLWLLAPRLLPERTSPLTHSQPRFFDSVIEVTEDSPLAGETLGDMRRMIKEDIRIQRVQRGDSLELVRLPGLVLRAGDRMHLRGTPEAIKATQNLFGHGFEEADVLRSPDQVLVEIVVTRDSSLYRRKLSDARRVSLGSLAPVGLHRPGAHATQSLDESSDPTLHDGDILLMQGDREEVSQLQESHKLLLLARNVQVSRSAKAPLAVGIMVGVVIVAAMGWMPISASALCGVGLMFLGRCLALEEAYRALDVRLILVIVTSLALGIALTFTGGAQFIALEFVNLVRDLPPAIVLSCILLLTAVLTEIVTNNAVAVIGTPIAIAVARELGMPELPFLLAVLFGSNMSYLTPIGYQTNLIVFSAGGYRFADFARAGVPLQILLWLTLSFALPIIYL
ncbi:MAG: SLC13 family permease [Woeseia sp.]|nr:SLC13 family permease [Woeseia sp.]